MAKVSFTNLKIKKPNEITTIEFNGQQIEVKKYLPYNEKVELVQRIVRMSLDDNNFANPMRRVLWQTLEITYAYTNINFTEKQKADPTGLYDMLVHSGLYQQIEAAIGKEEVFVVMGTVTSVIEEIYKFKNSAVGILQAAQADYNELNFDVESLTKQLNDKEDLGFLRDVLTKMG